MRLRSRVSRSSHTYSTPAKSVPASLFLYRCRGLTIKRFEEQGLRRSEQKSHTVLPPNGTLPGGTRESCLRVRQLRQRVGSEDDKEKKRSRSCPDFARNSNLWGDRIRAWCSWRSHAQKTLSPRLAFILHNVGGSPVERRRHGVICRERPWLEKRFAALIYQASDS